MSDPTGLNGMLPGLRFWPGYWSGAGGDFDCPPDVLVIHSGATGDNVAAYLRDPFAKPGTRGASECPDRIWRRQVCAHVSATTSDGDFVQQCSLLVPCWHAGGSLFRGAGRVNERSLSVELPAHEGEELRDQFVALVTTLVLSAPTLRYYACHRWIRGGKRDPVCWDDQQVRGAMEGLLVEAR
jgi:hypothetical protein